MNNFLPILRILYWIYAIATFIPVYFLISNTIKIPILDFIIALFISGIPIINIIVGIIGAVSVMEIPVLGAILFYFAPQIIFLIYCLISKEK